jgi:hypothetical protein
MGSVSIQSVENVSDCSVKDSDIDETTGKVAHLRINVMYDE